MRSKDSRAVWRGAIGKVPIWATRWWPTLLLVRCGLELGGNPLPRDRNGRPPSISILVRITCQTITLATSCRSATSRKSCTGAGSISMPGSRSPWPPSMCWSSGMAYGLPRRASCPSRSLNLVCKIPISLLGSSEPSTIGSTGPSKPRGKVMDVLCAALATVSYACSWPCCASTHSMTPAVDKKSLWRGKNLSCGLDKW